MMYAFAFFFAYFTYYFYFKGNSNLCCKFMKA